MVDFSIYNVNLKKLNLKRIMLLANKKMSAKMNLKCLQ